MLPVRWRAWLVVMYVMCAAASADDTPRVQVVDPFLEFHTGPGRGYPLFHVVERGEWVEILKRRTDWFKVRAADGKEGWVARAQMERTAVAAGIATRFRDTEVEDYRARRVEFGFAGGWVESDPLMLVRAGYRFTEQVAGELTYGQISGDFASAQLRYVGLRVEPFGDERVSPFFTLGVGRFDNTPRATLVNRTKTRSDLANAGIGVNYYLTDRFMLRADYKAHAVFIDADRTSEYKEVSLGVSFFF